MKEIRFNHNYKKLHNQTSAGLVYVGILKSGNNFSKEFKEFIDYDTEGQYKIEEDTAYLFLVFVGNDYFPFTTLRKLNKENTEKYVGREGKVFKIVIEEQKEDKYAKCRGLYCSTCANQPCTRDK